VSRFDENDIRKLASMSVRSCRGRREQIFPFRNKEPALRRALVRAETAYDKSLKQQTIIDHCLYLKSIFEEEKRFATKFN